MDWASYIAHRNENIAKFNHWVHYERLVERIAYGCMVGKPSDPRERQWKWLVKDHPEAIGWMTETHR